MSRKKLFTLLAFYIVLNHSFAQTYLYFQDSNRPVYYDYSLLELSAPSDLERNVSDLTKFPVETGITALQGSNSLRLHWLSNAGGDWLALIAATAWTSYNISGTDTLSFWVYSLEGISATNLPKVCFQDVNNVKTLKTEITTYSTDIQASNWTRIKIPMSIYLSSNPLVDFTKIKTVGFAQNTADGIYHTLLIDDVRVYKGNAGALTVSAPTGLTAKGYDSHVRLKWTANTEANCTGYRIYQSIDAGATYQIRKVLDKSQTVYTDFVAKQGENLTLKYRISALNDAYIPSGFSVSTEAATHVFTDDELLDMVQEATFRYFWDYAHPSSGLARERTGSGNTVTIGGSGFGLMALLSGIDRNFVTRTEGAARILKIVNFLTTANRFHGVWPHWMNGNSGTIIPFSTYDNGGDLVETAFLVQGLLAVRQYFNQSNATEKEIVQKITALWQSVEWDWYSNNNSGALYWHWSPNYAWQMNMPIKGWNEGLIVYLLAIASPTHSVPSTYWSTGWASNSSYINGKSFYGYPLKVGWNYGGPLFFAHYSFLGFDARNLKDKYTNYFTNNTNHTLINRAYCVENPKKYAGYSANCWGLTASDDPTGYLAHEPTTSDDNGTISPTAALSSIVYTPQFSLDALKYFYRQLGQYIWGEYGFVDAFNLTSNWYATSYLAIDQGPIIAMIENYRSGLLWKNFMANPEIEPALKAIGFVADNTGIEEQKVSNSFSISILKGADKSDFRVNIKGKPGSKINAEIFDTQGKLISKPINNHLLTGEEEIMNFSVENLIPGIYFLKANDLFHADCKMFIVNN
ncbi:MAG: glucoamylase family protein [Bacteroidia bacterium]